MASYSEACLGLPWRTAALDRLLWQDEATRYAVHGLACSAGWRRLYIVCGCPTLGLRSGAFEFDAAPHFLRRDE